MEYRPALPERNSNVTHTHPLREFVMLLSAVLAVAVFSFWCLGLLVDSVVDNLSAQSEATLSKAIAVQLPATPAALRAKQQQVQALLDALQPCAGLSMPAQVRLVASEDANAMVFAGGTMLVMTGLLERVQSANGLSFVLAHELAHLKQRDHLRLMGRGLVLMSLSALLTGQDSGLTELLLPAQQIGGAHYSRERESLADARALQILACRYGHVGGATELFEALNGQDSQPGWSHYLASHPSMQQRIDVLNRAISAAGFKSAPVLPLPVHEASLTRP